SLKTTDAKDHHYTNYSCSDTPYAVIHIITVPSIICINDILRLGIRGYEVNMQTPFESFTEQ
ncbi:4917_t:CDS:1, partial [Funneliformis geosporum]